MSKNFYLIIVFLIIFMSCKGNNYKYSDSYSSSPDLKSKRMELAKSEDSFIDKDVKEEAIQTNNDVQNIKIDKKIIKRAAVYIEIKDIKSNEIELNKIVNQFDGYVSISNVYEASSYYEVKIPSDKLDMFIEIISKFGRVTSKNVTTEDVTLQYYDLETRINTKKILQERYIRYLRDAKSTKELLDIELALNNVTSDIEAFETQMRNLKHLISYSTININFSVPSLTPTNFINFDFPSVRNGFVVFINFIVAFFYYLFFILLFIVPFILIVGLVYYLTFGKIGLVKKYFKKMKGD